MVSSSTMFPKLLNFLLILVSMSRACHGEGRYRKELVDNSRSNPELEEQWMKDSGDLKENITPEFEHSIVNSLSIVEGKDGQLECRVKGQGSHEVSWYHIDKQLLLTVEDKVKTSNPRIKVVRNGTTFTLFIDSIRLEDAGYYACRINTRPPKSQVKYLQVVVEPRFLDPSIGSETTLVVKEHENATLSCKAVASPVPIVKWKREDGRPIILSPFSKSQDTVTGDELSLTQVSRWMSGSFICTVTSGISQPISRRISLLVHFPPMIMIPSQLLTIATGYSVTLECHVESQPLARQEWHGPKAEKIISTPKTSWKFAMNEHKVYSFKIIYKLTLFQVDPSDSGHYTCVARNRLGVTRSSLTLQVTDDWKQTTSTASTTRRMIPSTTETTTNLDILFHRSLPSPGMNTSKIALDDSSLDDGKPLEVFINLTGPLKNRTKNIWAHFTTSGLSTPLHTNFYRLIFSSLLFQLHHFLITSY